MIPKEFSLRKSNILYLSLAIVFTGTLVYFAFGPYEKTRVIFRTNFPAACIFIMLFIGATCYSWYNFFNKRSAITFGSEGIIYKKNLTPWQNIKSFKTVNYLGDTIDSLQLVLTLSNTSKEYVIPLLGFDTDKQHIRACIEDYSNSSIIDEGHFDKN